MTRVARHLLLPAALDGACRACLGIRRALRRSSAIAPTTARSAANTRTRTCRRHGTTCRPTWPNTATARQIIGAAITGGSDKGQGRGSPGQGVGGAGAADPGEAAARAKDAEDLEAITSGAGSGSGSRAPEVQVGEESVEPGTNGLFDLSSASNQLPTPLLIALIALGLLALAGGFVALRGRVPALTGFRC